jgi:excisionase family DNA binding protein
MQPLHTVEQTSQILGVSKPTIYRLVAQGVLPAVIIARRARKKIIRFRQEAIEKFIRERETR